MPAMPATLRRHRRFWPLRPNVAAFDNTIQASETCGGQSPVVQPACGLVQPERSHYFDVGVAQRVLPGLEVGVDAYYKLARDLLDDGQFGAALVLDGFNYERARNEGIELKANYQSGNFRAYGNIAVAQQKGTDIVSNQFLFGADEFAFIADHYIYTDHSQTVTASAGASYLWEGTRFSADLIYGSGLRTGDFNQDHVPAYTQVNIGVSHEFTWRQTSRQRCASMSSTSSTVSTRSEMARVSASSRRSSGRVAATSWAYRKNSSRIPGRASLVAIQPTYLGDRDEGRISIFGIMRSPARLDSVSGQTRTSRAPKPDVCSHPISSRSPCQGRNSASGPRGDIVGQLGSRCSKSTSEHEHSSNTHEVAEPSVWRRARSLPSRSPAFRQQAPMRLWLNCHLRTNLNNAVNRDLEIGCCILGAACKSNEQAFLPARHLGLARHA